jgi:hypothetical protein
MSCRSTAGSSGMTSYAQACTGLTERGVAETFHALKREGVGLSDPDAGQVEEFLEGQEFRVRHDETLPTTRRESIVRRLRQALADARSGRYLPDGATFHAWKHVVSEAWRRSRRKAAAVALTGALTFGVSACGSTGDRPQEPAAGSSPTVSAPAEPAGPATVRVPEQMWNEAPMPTGNAAETFGQDKVNQAYRQMLDHTFATAWNCDRMRTPASGLGEQDFAAVEEAYTPYAKATWRERAARVGSDAEAAEGVFNSTLYGLEGDDSLLGPGHTVIGNGTDCIGKISFGGAVADVDELEGERRLALAFDATADVHMKDPEGQPYVLRITKKQTLWLVENDDIRKPWLIDGSEQSITGDAL